jgi:hypothetical protein
MVIIKKRTASSMDAMLLHRVVSVHGQKSDFFQGFLQRKTFDSSIEIADSKLNHTKLEQQESSLGRSSRSQIVSLLSILSMGMNMEKANMFNSK